MPSATKKKPNTGKETVFLAGTDHVKDVLSTVEAGLRRMGFAPWWFHKDFPLNHPNAMDSCIEAARMCDRLVLVVDERAGLPYPKTGTTITEAEFNVAHERGIRCLVFVRDRIWYQSH